MMCSLLGLSPVDILLHDIGASTFKDLIFLMNNRFDHVKLDNVKAEMAYVYKILNNNLQFDYIDREHRKLNARLSAGVMTAFGGVTEDEARLELADAPKQFSGRVKTKAGVIELINPRVISTLERLYNSRHILQQYIGLVEKGSYQDEVFFGNNITKIATHKSYYWMYNFAASKIKKDDDVAKVYRDAIRLKSYIQSPKNQTNSTQLPVSGDLERAFVMLGGSPFNNQQNNLCKRYINILSRIDLEKIESRVISSLNTCLFTCMLSDLTYDSVVNAEFEACGLYFLCCNKTDLMLTLLSDLTLVPESTIILTNKEGMDSLSFIISAIERATSNHMYRPGDALRG